MFKESFEVRDYECDLQGIVNNAVYQHYLEHTRHQFLKHKGLDFAKLHQENIDPVVYRIEIDYKKPLKSGDKFHVSLQIEREGNLKFIFHQQIFRGEELITKAKVIIVFTSSGKPILPPKEIIRTILS
ncbi:acyl-CoA thioesterase [Pedobacter puniceum]|jgi:acyl-CoA thioester hydrolase|uniref:YbgC/FadM family acyl-CoA thioesterase n=1 Tax=Pedobacter puniceum TaxID=2666136 RepID=A0A7K0FLG8_9SPHI|nr:thioesterase family protein [Pedobacter puniceum]MRX46491.1 YbgC/FadM family acyl-CoA thioesterase [Pedobacter puniceum]